MTAWTWTTVERMTPTQTCRHFKHQLWSTNWGATECNADRAVLGATIVQGPHSTYWLIDWLIDWFIDLSFYTSIYLFMHAHSEYTIILLQYIHEMVDILQQSRWHHRTIICNGWHCPISANICNGMGCFYNRTMLPWSVYNFRDFLK